jgi:ATP synthase protein I
VEVWDLMEPDPDPNRLRALEARLAKVTVKPKAPDTETGKAFSQGEVAWRMVIELVSGMLLGLSIGYGLDYAFGTIPIFLILFSLLGFAGGVRTMMGTARELNEQGAGKPAQTKDETHGG